MANAMSRRIGAALFLLSKTQTVAAIRPSWSRLYSSLHIRGGATESAADQQSDDTKDPFGNLQGIEPSRLTIQRTDAPREKPAKANLVFGATFTDHMLEIDWDSCAGWHAPKISPFGDLRINPAASSLHYALQCFEGMKAYRDREGNVRLFRPQLNVRRLNRSLERLHFPTVNETAILEVLSKLVVEDADWIPDGDGYSLYIRPTAISTHPYLGVSPAQEIKLYVILSPVGPYYKEGFKPIKLYADTENRRAWPGGMGFAKAGGNYAPTILPQIKAQQHHDCAQILWLFGEEHLVTEVGAMNIFFLIEKEGGGGVELITSPLDAGDILEGVTRSSVLELARSWPHAEDGQQLDVSERRLAMKEVVRASEEGRLKEVFGSGTAAVIAPVRGIKYMGRDIEVPTGNDAGPFATRLWKTLTDIQYGRVDHPWSVRISGDM